MALKNNAKEREDVIFATVLADGKIHVAVPEGTENAVKREYETSDGKAGFKWEHVYTELSGIVQKLEFKEGDYGINLQITVGEEGDEKPVTLALGTESNFGEDLMKKLPNIDFDKPVTFAPYSFDNDKGKKQRGISVTQEIKKGEKEKVKSFYYDEDKKAITNGYPKPPVAAKGKVVSKVQWRKYFGEAREFLIADVTDRLELKATDESEATRVFNEM